MSLELATSPMDRGFWPRAQLCRLIARFLRWAALFFVALVGGVGQGLAPIKTKTPQERGKTKPDNARPAEARPHPLS